MAQEQVRGRRQAEGRSEIPHVELDAGDAVPSVAAIKGHPIHPMLIPLPIGFLVAALLADLGYVLRDDPFFARAAALLVGAGTLAAYAAAAPGLVDWFSIRRARTTRSGLVHAVGNGIVLVLATANTALRLGAESAEAAVVPWGLALSLAIGLLLAVTGWAGGELSYRHLVGANPSTASRRQVHTELE